MLVIEMTAMQLLGMQVLALMLAFFAYLAFRELLRSRVRKDRVMLCVGLGFLVGLPAVIGLSALQAP